MGYELSPSSVSSRAATLGRKWADRDRKFRDWYKIIKLEDKMKEENKESFVSNSPRTFYNLAKHLLTPKYIPHKFPYEELDLQTADEAKLLAQQFERYGWKKLERLYKKSGRQSFVDRIAAHILTLGWYAVYAHVDENGLHADVWNPAEVFPEYSINPEEGLVELSHIYKVPRRRANYQLGTIGLYDSINLTSAYYNVYEYWFYDDEGFVCRASTLAGKWYNQPERLPQYDTIPILVGPVGGLPDEGVLDPHFMQTFGEGCVAVNEGVYTNSDRLASFLQQAVRDATEPKWLELSQGGAILTPENFKSGGIFRGEPGDSVNSLQPPPIPVELQQRLFDYEQKKQEGSFSPLLYGSIQFKLAAYTLSQMAQAAQQVLRPYHEGMMAVLSGIDNQWLAQMRSTGIRPNGITIPAGLPDDTEMLVEYPVSIPGDLINRITVAKMMNPEMRFSAEYIFKNLFPEVQDTMTETAKSRKDMAMNSEMGILVAQIKAFRLLAEEASVRRDPENVELYTAAAERGLNMLKGKEEE